MRLSPECKTRVGTEPEVVWTAPCPVKDDPADKPVCTIGGTGVPLSLVASASTITAMDAADRRRLTASAPVSLPGLPGEFGDAFLLTEGDGVYPVVVVRAVGTTVYLAETLPRGIDLTSPAQLEWAGWKGTVPAALTATETGDTPHTWSVTYKTDRGASAPSEDGQEEGILHVRRRPFTTGLRHSYLVRLFPSLAAQTPRGEEDFGAAIEAGERLLINHLRRLLRGRVLDSGARATEDDVIGAPFLDAHAWLSASIAQERDPGGAAEGYPSSLRARGLEMVEEALELAWVDADGDGVAEEGETEQVVAGRAALGFRSTMSTSTPSWTKGRAR